MQQGAAAVNATGGSGGIGGRGGNGGLFERLARWLTRPPLRERVLTCLEEAREPLPGLEIARRLNLWAAPYPLLGRLEDEGLVASRPEPSLAVYSEGRVYHRRVYWLTPKGRRRRALDPGMQPMEAFG